MTRNAEKQKASVQTKALQPPKQRRGIIFVIIFLISAWMFFLGVLVGRGTAPVSFDIEKIHKDLAFLREQAFKNDQSAQEKVPKIRNNLGFYEALKKEQENDPLVTRDLKDGRSSDFAKKEYKKIKKKTKKPQQVLKQKQEISNKKRFSIQVASSRNKKDADKLVAKYIQKGFPSYMTSVDVEDTGTWHRVKIGPYETLAEAGSILHKVKKLKHDAFLVKHD